MYKEIDETKIKAIKGEIEAIQKERDLLSEVNSKMNNYERYNEILKIIQKDIN